MMTQPQVISLFPKGIELGVGITDPRQPKGDLHPSEAASVTRAVPKRRDEFRAGRDAARQAMRAIGATPVALPSNRDRLPEWPAGLVGSITHCDDLCLAVVSTKVRAIGVDVEPAIDLSADLWGEILLPDELTAAKATDRPGLAAKLVFSAKEAAYKAQYPLSRTLFGFHDLSVDIAPDGEFQAEFRVPAGPFEQGDKMQGRYLATDTHIVTAVVLT